MKAVTATEQQADICLLLEGTWPYVRGGVSSWIHQMLLGLPELRFSILFIGGQRSNYSKMHYDMPSNVVHYDEVFIAESWQQGTAPKKAAPVADEEKMAQLYRFFHDPEAPQPGAGQALLESLISGSWTVDQVLRSRASWDVLSDGYFKHCTDPSFINYFWTLRTIQPPVIMLSELARRLPKARAVHAISTGYAGLLGAMLKQLWGCDFILSEHGIYTKERKIDLAQAGWVAENPDEELSGSLDPSAGYIRTLWIRFFERIGMLVYQSANPVVSLYEGNRRRQIKDGAEAQRTRVIPNGIDLQRWSPMREQRPQGIAQVAGLIGRIVPIKDVKTFIRSMRSVVNVTPGAEGWIIGPGAEDPEYARECQSLVSSLGLSDNVRFLGFQDIKEIMPRLGVLVLTSISEAQPLVILEAWSAGTPVVSSDVGSCREMIEGSTEEDRALGLAGEVVSIADPQATARAIMGLLGSPERWKEAQAAGLARVNRYYSDELMFQRYRQLYRAALEAS